MTVPHRLTCAAALLAALPLAGCGASATHHMAAAPAAAARTAGAPRPSVAVLAPAPAVRSGSTVRVRVRLTHFRINANMVGMTPRPGEGHLHFILDGGRFDHPRYSGANGRIAVKLGVDGKYSPSLTPGITYRHLPAGPHTVQVELANNNHTSTGVVVARRFVVG